MTPMSNALNQIFTVEKHAYRVISKQIDLENIRIVLPIDSSVRRLLKLTLFIECLEIEKDSSYDQEI
jgi:hypothetical protein